MKCDNTSSTFHTKKAYFSNRLTVSYYPFNRQLLIYIFFKVNSSYRVGDTGYFTDSIDLVC